MASIHSFATFDLIKVFISLNANLMRKVGEGSEGSCYLSSDGFVYKLYDGPCENHINQENVITKDEIDLESFNFPREVYIVNGEVRGHKSDFFPHNRFGFDTIEYFELDYEALAKAYDVFLQDVHKLTEKGIYLFELCYNLMFDGIRLVACDTCDYRKLSNFDFEELFKKNVEIVDYAIDQELVLKAQTEEIEYRSGDFKKYYNQRQNRK
jgi:hypothetical protein